MIKVLIADDMAEVRESLEKMLGEYPEEITIVGSVPNGKQALQVIAQTLPQLVITDISMPVIDGLALSQKLKEAYPKMKILFISGHEEFEYAKKAIQLKISDYLLKPIRKEILYRSLAKIIQEIDREKEQVIERAHLYDKLKEADVLLKEKQFHHMLETNQEQPSHATEKFIAQCFGLQCRPYTVTVMKFHRFYEIIDEKYGGDGQTVKSSVKNVIKNLHQQQPYECFFSMQREDECILIRYGDRVVSDSSELDFTRRLKVLLEQFTCFRVSIGTSQIGQDFKALKSHYEEACYALRYRLLDGRSACYQFIQISHRMNIKSYLKNDDETLLYFAVKNGEKNKSKQFIGNLFKQIEHEANASLYSLQNLYTSLVLLFNKLTVEMNDDYSSLKHLRFLNVGLDEFEDLQDIRQEVTRAFEALADCMIEAKLNKKDTLVGSIKAYLNEHYAEDISLQGIAEMFYVNASYLSQLFKKETNCTFSQYMIKLRMEKAKKMIEQGNAKIWEVAIHVGYNSVSYFIQNFRKIYRITPEQLRKNTALHSQSL